MMNDPRRFGQAEAGLCSRCTWAQVVTNARGSRFYLCRLSFTDPRFVRYPTLPVIECQGFSASEDHDKEPR